VPRSIAWLTSRLAAAAFATIFVVNIGQIVARSLGGGWVWVSDLSQLLFIWTVMLGAAAAYCLREHIVASFLLDRVSGAAAKVLALLIRTLEATFFAILAIAGTRVAAVRADIDYIQLQVPTAWAYYAIPVAATLMLVAAITLSLRPQEPTVAVEETSTHD
jgi:TRAP-type C4-dicarboxylate transport system permease small subunit